MTRKIAASLAIVISLNTQSSEYWEQVLVNTQQARVGELSIDTPLTAPVSSHFGMRFHPIHEINKLHRGTDYAGEYGQPFHAANSGQVVFSGEKGQLGLTIAIKHSNGYTSRYAHASRLLVNVGDYVEKGDRIGEVGDTGLVTGPHLHFELIKDGEHIDPSNFVSFTNYADHYDPFEAVLTSTQKALIGSELYLSNICKAELNCFAGLKVIYPKKTESTWSIAKSLVSETNFTIYQALAGLRLLNPLVFKNGDINLRTEGELTLPDERILRLIDPEVSKNEFDMKKLNRVSYKF